jgi:hypothetical protein
MNARWLILLVLLSATALAESRVYRCDDAKGHTTFQNEPCPPGTRVKGAVTYTPDRPPTREELQARRELEEWQRARSQRNAGTAWITQPAPQVYRTTPGPAPESREAKRQECERAKAERDAFQDRHRGVADSSEMARLRKWVRDACHMP